VLSALDTKDVILTMAKGLLFGLVIGLLPSYHGLKVTRGPTEIPQAVTRGTVGAITSVFVITAVLMAIFDG
jgi:ABC-type transporter Mla maintaining outer membrane lipid asymmetry permease subunit MlaE